MPKQLTLQLSPVQASDQSKYMPIAARLAGVTQDRIALARVLKRSIDARNRSAKVNMTIELYIDQEELPQRVNFDYPQVGGRVEVIVVGAGPAGLFAALRLIELGYKPILLERGNAVPERKRDVAAINCNGVLNPDSNYAFGEGGAGTFSDGKLFTRSKKRGDHNRALQILHFHGAQQDILFDAHPHIGTDHLPTVIMNIRKSITDAGGEIHFGKKVTGFSIVGERIKGVFCSEEKIDGAAVVLSTGHSAKDIYKLLHAHGIALEAKEFAMGVRVEHPQALIDSFQYHTPQRDPFLPPATYSLVSQIRSRGVYSFCMCPGGVIVPAMTSPDESVVNGMSSSGRNSVFANSGIVTQVRFSDFAHLTAANGPLAGLVFQEKLEQAARRNAAEAQRAPAQRLADFVAGKPSRSLPPTSYHPGVSPSQLDIWLPKFIYQSLREGFASFDRRIKGFVTNEAVVLGVESRTSSPVRIPRNPTTLMHPGVEGLFPCAEGAGYAGGIISAALDGERVAECVASYLK